MAVQAQYPSNVLLLNRNVQESKSILSSNDYSLQPQLGGGGGGRGGGFVDQSHMIFNNNGGGVGINPRKRSREIEATHTAAATTTPTTANTDSFNFCLQNHQNQLIDLSQLQNHQQQQQRNQTNNVSTGLKLYFGDQNQQQTSFLSLLSEEIALQFKQPNDELFQFLNAQGEHLRRTLTEKRQRNYRALLGTAEEVVARRVKGKEAEVEKAARTYAELEERAAQLNTEAQSWRAKAQAHEAHAASLQARIQQVMVGPSGKSQQQAEEDAESAYVDPASERRVNSPSCKVCRKRAASVVLLPCRHLCVCVACDGVVQACPLCLALRSASVEVYLT